MRKVLKALLAIGCILLVVGLAGRVIGLGRATAANTEDERTSSDWAQYEVNRERVEVYKWIGFAGGILVLGSRLALRVRG